MSHYGYTIYTAADLVYDEELELTEKAILGDDEEAEQYDCKRDAEDADWKPLSQETVYGSSQSMPDPKDMVKDDYLTISGDSGVAHGPTYAGDDDEDMGEGDHDVDQTGTSEEEDDDFPAALTGQVLRKLAKARDGWYRTSGEDLVGRFLRAVQPFTRLTLQELNAAFRIVIYTDPRLRDPRKLGREHDDEILQVARDNWGKAMKGGLGSA